MKKLHQILLFFSLFCLFLNFYNILFIGDLYPAYLVWNLFLAFIPYLLATYLGKYAKKKKANKWIQSCLIFAWLIFFPNTIYLVTDFLHLYEQTYLPVWFDIAQIFSYTWIAFFFGFLSLYTVEKVLTKKFGPNRSLIFVFLAIWLASIGVYLGRHLRWNSWDLLIQPWQIIIHTIEVLAHPGNFLNFMGMTTVFSGMFIGVYFSLRALLQSKGK